MDFFEVIRKRHSYRGAFQSLPIPDEDIREIMDGGVRAPSGYNRQTTSFIVVTDEELRKKLAELVPTPTLKTAPAIVIPLSQHIVTHENLASLYKKSSSLTSLNRDAGRIAYGLQILLQLTYKNKPYIIRRCFIHKPVQF